MKSPMAKAVLVFFVLIAGTLGLIAWKAVQSRSVLCEVCVTYRGASVCREAYGPNREQAVETAQGNACAFLASGMTASVACQNTPPDRVRCEGD